MDVENPVEQKKPLNKSVKGIIIFVVIMVLVIIVLFFYFQHENKYKENVSSAYSQVERGDYETAYKTIKDLNPKKEDKDLFDKIKLITFSKTLLAHDYDFESTYGEPDFERTLSFLFTGLIGIENDKERAIELGVSQELSEVYNQYLDQLFEYYRLSEREVNEIIQLSSEERDVKLKDIAPVAEILQNQANNKEMEQKHNEANPIEITEKDGKIDGDYIYVTGAVKNISKTVHSYIKIKVTHYDDSGNVIDTDWTYAVGSEELRPNEQKYFETMTKYRDGMKKYKVEVTDYQ